MRDGRFLVIGRQGRNTLRTMSAAINISSALVSYSAPFSIRTVNCDPSKATVRPLNVAGPQTSGSRRCTVTDTLSRSNVGQWCCSNSMTHITMFLDFTIFSCPGPSRRTWKESSPAVLITRAIGIIMSVPVLTKTFLPTSTSSIGYAGGHFLLPAPGVGLPFALSLDTVCCWRRDGAFLCESSSLAGAISANLVPLSSFAVYVNPGNFASFQSTNWFSSTPRSFPTVLHVASLA